MEAVAAVLKFFVGLALIHFQKYVLLEGFLKTFYNIIKSPGIPQKPKRGPKEVPRKPGKEIGS